MSAVRADLEIAVVRLEHGWGFALVDAEGCELSNLGEGALEHEIRAWIAGYLIANADTIGGDLAQRFYAAYRAVKTG